MKACHSQGMTGRLLQTALWGWALLAAPELRAITTNYWTNSLGGDYQTAGNWSLGSVPNTTNDIAVFDLANSYTVTWSAPITNMGFKVNRGSIIWNLQSNTYSYSQRMRPNIGTSTSTVDLVITNGRIVHITGAASTANVDIWGTGTTVRVVSTTNSYLNYPNVYAPACLIVDGANTICYIQGKLNVYGTLVITNGARFDGGTSSQTIQSGGILKISGANSRFTGGSTWGINCGLTGGAYITQGGWLGAFNAASTMAISANSHVVMDSGLMGNNCPITSSGGFIEGQGDTSGTFYNSGGWVRPGGSNGVGLLKFVVFHNTNSVAKGTIDIELGGPTTNQFDRMVISSTFYAGGTLSVRLINGYQPRHGERFDILDFASVINAFETLNLQSERCWDLRNLYTTGEIRYMAPGTIFQIR